MPLRSLGKDVRMDMIKTAPAFPTGKTRFKYRIAACCFAISSAFSVFAVDSDGYYIYKPDWSGGSGAWADGPRWYDGVAPSENCKVKIGNGAVAEVSDEDMAIVEKLAEIRLHTENSVIQFNVVFVIICAS